MTVQGIQTERLRYGGIIVFVLSAGYLIWGMASGLLWHDTGEFGAVGWRLSLSHPPGHPAHAMLTHTGMRLIPFGDLGLRSNMVSALCVAAALGALFAMMNDGLMA